MKLEIFNSCNDVIGLEEVINEFLSKKDIIINNILCSQSGTIEQYRTVYILYEERDKGFPSIPL